MNGIRHNLELHHQIFIPTKLVNNFLDRVVELDRTNYEEYKNEIPEQFIDYWYYPIWDDNIFHFLTNQPKLFEKELLKIEQKYKENKDEKEN